MYEIFNQSVRNVIHNCINLSAAHHSVGGGSKSVMVSTLQCHGQCQDPAVTRGFILQWQCQELGTVSQDVEKFTYSVKRFFLSLMQKIEKISVKISNIIDSFHKCFLFINSTSFFSKYPPLETIAATAARETVPSSPHSVSAGTSACEYVADCSRGKTGGQNIRGTYQYI